MCVCVRDVSVYTECDTDFHLVAVNVCAMRIANYDRRYYWDAYRPAKETNGIPLKWFVSFVILLGFYG